MVLNLVTAIVTLVSYYDSAERESYVGRLQYGLSLTAIILYTTCALLCFVISAAIPLFIPPRIDAYGVMFGICEIVYASFIISYARSEKMVDSTLVGLSISAIVINTFFEIRIAIQSAYEKNQAATVPTAVPVPNPVPNSVPVPDPEQGLPTCQETRV